MQPGEGQWLCRRVPMAKSVTARVPPLQHVSLNGTADDDPVTVPIEDVA